MERPIIILGVNHSGTRVLVDMLSALGSDGGDFQNPWRENKFFLDIHNRLIGAVDGKDWTRKIFRTKELKSFALQAPQRQAILDRLKKELPSAYPAYKTRPWHWKCPTSALFIDFWLSTFPDAYYVHIVRDPLDVAQSLLSRRQFYTIRSAYQFYDLMEERLTKAAAASHYLKIRYENLIDEVPRLIEFMPFLDGAEIDNAKRLIHQPGFRWKPSRTLKHNLWNTSVAIRVRLAKAMRMSKARW